MRKVIVVWLLSLFSVSAFGADTIFADLKVMSQKLDELGLSSFEGSKITELNVDRVTWAEDHPATEEYNVQLTYMPVVSEEDVNGEGGPGICQARLVVHSPQVCARVYGACDSEIKVESNLCWL